MPELLGAGKHQKEERYDLWRECAQAHKYYDEFKVSKHNLWVECEKHKKFVSFSKRWASEASRT